MFLGFDGGGSKTKLTVMSRFGEVVFVGVGGASNLNVVSKEEVIENITALVRESKIELSGVTGVCFGAAGASSEGVRRVLNDILASVFPNVKILIVSDAVAAVKGGLGDKSGVAIVSGTGSVAISQNDRGELFKVGGRGYLLGDEGSGYDIGKRVLSAVLREFDGLGEGTVLTSLVCGFLKIDNPEKIIPAVYERRISPAIFAPLCEKAYFLGDHVAKNIVTNAAFELFLLYKSAEKRAGLTNADCVIMGGVGENMDSLRQTLITLIEGDGGRVIPIESDASHGCCALIRREVLGRQA